MDVDGEEDEDEDEETLQLKLQEIQARLRLKKLQSAKGKDQEAGHGTNKGLSRSRSAMSVSDQRRGQRATTPGADENTRPVSTNPIQVAASPVRKAQAPQAQTSPSRVLLGIDKGLKARDISLKRAPSHKKTQGLGAGSASQTGGYLRTSRTPIPAAVPTAADRPLSFNERLASVRTEEAERADKQKRIQNMRSNAFSIGQEEMERFKNNAADMPDEPVEAPAFSRDEIMSNSNRGAGGLQRSNTVPSIRSNAGDGDSASGSTPNASSKNKQPGKAEQEQPASFEPYSSFHLSRRNLPHQELARHISGKKVLNIKDLLKVVKAPDFSLPDVEQDIVVFAVVAKKSEPRAHKPAAGKNGTKAEDRGKYMVMTLVDLKFELELFLFNSGFTRFWKLTEGTVVAILNPVIMPPPRGREDTGRFSLVINSDEDTIIEIGTARDLGVCQSLKKDGQLCGAWVNKKKTQFCEFHSNEALRKKRSSRMEVNGSSFGGKDRWAYHKSREVYTETEKDKLKKKAGTYDGGTQTHYFATRSLSAADLIDGKDRTPADRKERAEGLKRNLEAKERERDMMKKLGKIGNSAGREYMQHSGSRADDGTPVAGSSMSSQLDSVDLPPPKPDAQALGLLNRSNSAIHLSPIKRKRADSSQAGSVMSSGGRAGGGGSSSSSRSGAAFGWGGGLKSKLSRMKEGENLQPKEQGADAEGGHVRKKTRFVTAKGIREAGRESLGTELAERQVELDDDDDELVIVR